MKKFIFPLEKVLTYNNSLLDEEKAKLTALRNEARLTEELIDQNLDSMRLDGEKLAATAEHGATVTELRSISFKIENTRHYIEQLRATLRKQQAAAEKQLAVVVELNQSVSGMERLKEKQLESYNEDIRKAENETISELVSMRYVHSSAEQQPTRS